MSIILFTEQSEFFYEEHKEEDESDQPSMESFEGNEKPASSKTDKEKINHQIHQSNSEFTLSLDCIIY